MEISINIDKDNTNKLLNRRELELTATYAERTPSRAEIKDAIVHKLALNPETVVIIKISQEFGARRCKVIAHAYESKEAIKIEKAHLLERGTKKKEKKVEEKATASASTSEESAKKVE
ncbi:MAG: 30S ribosomal protein S24e [Candidatus Micrarchaeia archaeon]